MSLKSLTTIAGRDMNETGFNLVCFVHQMVNDLLTTGNDGVDLLGIEKNALEKELYTNE